ncbi:glycoside hydrolase family 25 protein [Pacificoceanicola onchidii]|uniref:glycoside hydrolase family 25 protein n=1 Tax=Pacificoceanicola onchidii TaxID=2562685 RepID=UPI001455FA29|nr:GH25 family lysozyme [Pacificoceanicola onchidii]
MTKADPPVPIGFALVAFAGLVLFSWARPTVGVTAPQVATTANKPPSVAQPQPAKPKTGGAQAAASTTPLAGIDVSHYQGTVHWGQVARAGMQFAYVKATAGLTYKDPRYSANISGARKAGLTAGAYHFYIPGDDPIKQAEHYLSHVTVGPGSLPPALDLESIPASDSDSDVGDTALKWLKHVEEKTGCKPVIYSNGSYYREYLGKPLEGYPFWLAEYANHPRLPSGIKDWTFWQHSQTGRVTGITGHVDLDLFQGTPADLAALTCKGAS